MTEDDTRGYWHSLEADLWEHDRQGSLGQGHYGHCQPLLHLLSVLCFSIVSEIARKYNEIKNYFFNCEKIFSF